MDRLNRMERFISRILEVIITFFFFTILMLTIILVIMRYGFNAAIVGGNEAMNYLFIYTTALGAVISIGRGDHIKITYFMDKLTARSRCIVNIVNFFFIAFFNVVMVWYSLPWIRSTGYFESPVLRIPSWVVQVSVPVGCSLVVLYCLNHILIELLNSKSPSSRGAS